MTRACAPVVAELVEHAPGVCALDPGLDRPGVLALVVRVDGVLAEDGGHAVHVHHVQSTLSRKRRQPSILSVFWQDEEILCNVTGIRGRVASFCRSFLAE